MVQTLLFVSGLNTLLQSFFGTRLPAVIGGSYTYLPTTLSIILAGRYNDILDPQEVSGKKNQSLSVSLSDFFIDRDKNCRNLRGSCEESRVLLSLPRFFRSSLASAGFGAM